MKIYFVTRDMKNKGRLRDKLYLSKSNKLLVIIILFLMYFCRFEWEKNISIFNLKIKQRLKIGVVGVGHGANVGNNMIKYAISIVLSNLGYEPYIIGTHNNNFTINFANKTTNLVVIKKKFSEIKENDYDILMVNSDQTWRKFSNYFFDYGFLRFARNWNIKKFVYGTSIGFDYWPFTPKEDMIMKELLKNFTGVSVREMGSIKLIQKHLGITPEFVLDPTLLIDKKYYLNLIKDYKNKINNNNKYTNNDYIFFYTFGNIRTSEFKINRLYKELKFKKREKIFDFNLNNNQTIEDFLYYISNCKAVVTQSFHGTVFSIIFKKPFITISVKGWAEERFRSLGKLLGVEKRIVNYNQRPNINLLSTHLNVNYSLIKDLRKKSIDFIKKNLEI